MTNRLKWALAAVLALATMFPAAAPAVNGWWDYDYDYYDNNYWTNEDINNYYTEDWLSEDWWEDWDLSYRYGSDDSWWSETFDLEDEDYGTFGYAQPEGSEWFTQDNWNLFDYNYNYGNYYNWNDSDTIGDADSFDEQGWFDW